MDVALGRKLDGYVSESASSRMGIQSVTSNESFDEGLQPRKGGKRSLPPIETAGKKGEVPAISTFISHRNEAKYSLFDHILRTQAGEDDDYDHQSQKKEVQWKEDRLIDGSLNKHDLKQALDIYIENSMNQRIKLLILCPSSVLLYAHTAKVYKVTQQFPHAQFSTTACTPDVDNLDAERFQQLHTKLGDWFFGNGVPPEHIASAHVILACNFLTDRNRERTQEFRELCRKISPNTHLFVHEWNHCPDLYAFIQTMYLKDRVSPNLSKPYPTRTFLEDQGLDIVIEKNDGILASLFSCRRVEFSPGQIEYVICNDLQFKWVDEIKEKYERLKDDPNGRIWLISDASATNGLVGMVSCLLQEPIGPKLRQFRLYIQLL